MMKKDNETRKGYPERWSGGVSGRVRFDICTECKQVQPQWEYKDEGVVVQILKSRNKTRMWR